MAAAILGDMDITGLFSVFMRFLHIGSVAGLVGGALYARVSALPALNSIPEPERTTAAQLAQAKFRGMLLTLVVLVTISGLYNGFGPGAPHHSSTWQMWFGIKMLFALHFLSTAVLWAVSAYGDVTLGGKNKRRLVSLLASGFIIILIGSCLRYLTLHSL